MTIIDNIKRSPTISLSEKIKDLKSKGIEVLSLSIGEPHFNTDKRIIEEAYNAMLEGDTHYVNSQGILKLREEIANKVKQENSIQALPSNIAVIPAKFAIYASLISLLEEGDEVMISNPCWVSYESQIMLARGKPVYYNLNDDYSIDFDDLVSKVTNKTRAIIINSPHNPTGYVLTYNEVKQLVDIAKDYDIYLISDEIYEKFIYEGEHISPASLEFEHIITINGFSKAYAMTGWRLGYVVANDIIINKIVSFIDQTLTCMPPFIQRAALKCLQIGDSIYKYYRDEYRKNRDYVYKILSELSNIEVIKPKGTFYMFPKYNFQIDSLSFTESLLAKEKVAVVPGIAFGSKGEYHIRISFATSYDLLEKAMDRFTRFVRKFE